jgi:hypothetical protein
MTELAELKRAGRIEAIRERNANFHVFAFINGVRPNDDLIAASLGESWRDTRRTWPDSGGHPSRAY